MRSMNADRMSDVLAYEAPFLIEKLLKDHIVESAEEARALFLEVKRYFILASSDESLSWNMYSLRIDEVWHQFVLFTREYIDFGRRFFGRYIQHNPGNAPEHPTDTAAKASFESFQQRYQELFGIPVPDVWFDEHNITTERRIINRHIGKLTLRDRDQRIDLLDPCGDMILSVDDIARQGLEFVTTTRSFYVRELPGNLAAEEKIGLIATLVEYDVLRVAS